jgi:hypothetical protein
MFCLFNTPKRKRNSAQGGAQRNLGGSIHPAASRPLYVAKTSTPPMQPAKGIPPLKPGAQPVKKLKKPVVRRAGKQPHCDLMVQSAFHLFPAIVPTDLWNRAYNSINSRRLVNEKGQTIPRAGGRNGALHNLFAGLVADGNMNLPMHWRDKGKRDRPKLATSSKDVNGKTPNTIVYADFEAAFLTGWTSWTGRA